MGLRHLLGYQVACVQGGRFIVGVVVVDIYVTGQETCVVVHGATFVRFLVNCTGVVVVRLLLTARKVVPDYVRLVVFTTRFGGVPYVPFTIHTNTSCGNTKRASCIRGVFVRF